MNSPASLAFDGRFASDGLTLPGGFFTLPLPSVDPALPPRSAPPECPVGADEEELLLGPENALARVLLEAVAPPNPRFCPLVVYGPPGVGKSSLGKALLHHRRQNCPPAHALCVTGDDLARTLAHALETDSVGDLRRRYLHCDWLWVDDLEPLSSRPLAQEFLLAILDHLIPRQTAVLVTLRQPPLATLGLTPRLISRLSGGLVVPLQLPSAATRIELARRLAAQLRVPLDEATLTQVAGCEEGTLHDLLTPASLRSRLLSFATLPGSPPRPPLPAGKSTASLLRRIQSLVARHYGIPLQDLRAGTRRQQVAEARGLAMYLARRLAGLSYSQIGRQFGRRDHSTVLHACHKWDRRITGDEHTRRWVADLAAMITNTPGS